MRRNLFLSVVFTAAVATFAQSSQAVELLVASQEEGSRVIRFDFDAAPGARLAPDFVGPNGNGLFFPRGMAVGPDGLLYITSAGDANATDGKIQRYTLGGAYLGDFVSTGAGGLGFPSALLFDPSGDLIVSSFDGTTRKYDGSNGSFLGTLPDVGTAHDMEFGDNGFLYTVKGADNVSRYDAAGNFLDQPVINAGPNWSSMVKGPGGLMYLGSASSSGLVRFNPATGTLLDGGSTWGDTAGIGAIADVALAPDGNIVVSHLGTAGNGWVERIDINSGLRQGLIEGVWSPISIGSSGDIAFTPEPATIGLLAVGSLMMLRRRA